MPRPTSRKKAPIAKGIADLRQRLGETQASFSARLGVSLASIARWESTEFAPHYIMLNKLWLLAREHGHKDLMKVFRAQLDDLQGPDQRKVEKERIHYDCWRRIQTAVTEVSAEAQQLTDEGHPAGARFSAR